MRSALAGDFAFRVLRKACKKLTEFMQAAENRYLKVYTGELHEFTNAGDMRGWHADSGSAG